MLLFLTFGLISSERDDDENRAYEFGFTIDGQQHRHESKGAANCLKIKKNFKLTFISDVNGIIQGEFGFITADGIYHTTVYATDENGSFKILSMRSVRVSPRELHVEKFLFKIFNFFLNLLFIFLVSVLLLLSIFRYSTSL